MMMLLKIQPEQFIFDPFSIFFQIKPTIFMGRMKLRYIKKVRLPQDQGQSNDNYP